MFLSKCNISILSIWCLFYALFSKQMYKKHSKLAKRPWKLIIRIRYSITFFIVIVATIYRVVVQIKVYDRACSLNQLDNWVFLLYYFTLPIYGQFFFCKHVFKINRKEVTRKWILWNRRVFDNLRREIRLEAQKGVKRAATCNDVNKFVSFL